MKIFPDGPNAISDCEMLPIKNLTSLFLLTDRNVRVFLGSFRRSMLKQKRQLVEKKLSLKVVSLSNGVDNNNDDDVEVDRDVWSRLTSGNKNLEQISQKFGQVFSEIISAPLPTKTEFVIFFSFSTKIFRRCVVNEVVQLAGAALHSSEVTFLLLSQWKII